MGLTQMRGGEAAMAAAHHASAATIAQHGSIRAISHEGIPEAASKAP
jgi:hypothetical protein